MSSLAEYRRRARAAARSADYSQAGDFYRLAGDWQKATDAQLRGEKPDPDDEQGSPNPM